MNLKKSVNPNSTVKYLNYKALTEQKNIKMPYHGHIWYFKWGIAKVHNFLNKSGLYEIINWNKGWNSALNEKKKKRTV